MALKHSINRKFFKGQHKNHRYEQEEIAIHESNDIQLRRWLNLSDHSRHDNTKRNLFEQLKKTSDDGTTVFVQNDKDNTQTLETSLTISSKPVEIGGLNDYINYLNQSSVLTPTEKEKINVLNAWKNSS